MSILLNNKVLQAAEDKIESQLLPKNRGDYMKVVVAGLKVGMAKGPQSYAAQLRDSKDPLGDCAKGSVNLAFMLRNHTRGTMPIQAMIPAAMTLMLHALDFIDRAGIMKIGSNELVQATHIFTNKVFNNAKISPAMLKNMHMASAKVMHDPASVEAMHRKAGTKIAPAPDSQF